MLNFNRLERKKKIPDFARLCRNLPDFPGKFQILPPAWQNLENAGIFPTLNRVKHSQIWQGTWEEDAINMNVLFLSAFSKSTCKCQMIDGKNKSSSEEFSALIFSLLLGIGSINTCSFRWRCLPESQMGN